MGFKTRLHIGYCDGDAGSLLARALDAVTVESAILRCGGNLLVDGVPDNPQLTAIGRLMVRLGGQNVLGFLGREPVVLHPAGYVWLTFDGRSAKPVVALLRLLCIEMGCGVYCWDDEERDPTRLIARVEQWAS